LDGRKAEMSIEPFKEYIARTACKGEKKSTKKKAMNSD
jgi:hypothetical protein